MKSSSKSKNAPDSSWGGLRFFVILCHAGPNSGQPANAGAYVSCWINYPAEDGALAVAKHYIRDAGWITKRLIDKKWIRASDEYQKDDVAQYYKEAVTDGSCFVFHLYKRKQRGTANTKSLRQK